MARNPRTGDPVEVAARPVPVFKPSKELKDLVNVSEGRRPAVVAELVAAAGDDLLDDVRRADDARALGHLVLGDPAGLGARGAQPHLTAVADELGVEVLQGR